MAEAEPGLGISVAEDRRSVTVTLLPANGAAGCITLSLEQLTSAIRGLGRARQHMVCGLPRPPLEGQHVQANFEPSWYVEPELSLDGSALVFDHPWYGPMAFIVPRHHAEGIARALTLQSHMTSRTSTTPN